MSSNMAHIISSKNNKNYIKRIYKFETANIASRTNAPTHQFFELHPSLLLA